MKVFLHFHLPSETFVTSKQPMTIILSSGGEATTLRSGRPCAGSGCPSDQPPEFPSFPHRPPRRGRPRGGLLPINPRSSLVPHCRRGNRLTHNLPINPRSSLRSPHPDDPERSGLRESFRSTPGVPFPLREVTCSATPTVFRSTRISGSSTLGFRSTPEVHFVPTGLRRAPVFFVTSAFRSTPEVHFVPTS